MKVVNYTGLKKREKMMYNFLGMEIPGGGVSVRLVGSVLACEIIFNIFGIWLSKKTGIPYVNFSNGNSAFGIIFIIFPAVIGFVINKTKIKGHDLLSYISQALMLKFSPKYKDLDGNLCDDLKIRNCLYVDDLE